MDTKEKDQHRDSTSLISSHKGTKLLIECTLIGGLIPHFKITYKGRIISGMFSKNIWDNEAAIIKMATDVIEQRHIVAPFNQPMP